VANQLKDAILQVIANFEPRVTVTDIDVNFDYDNNGYNATIRYTIKNTAQPVVSTIFLERIR
jgi:predicted component of type VI protein secretion system